MNELLIEMGRYGTPMMFKASNLWVTKIEMAINIANVKFDVRGEGDTPEESVVDCNKNMAASKTDLIAP